MVWRKEGPCALSADLSCKDWWQNVARSIPEVIGLRFRLGQGYRTDSSEECLYFQRDLDVGRRFVFAKHALLSDQSCHVWGDIPMSLASLNVCKPRCSAAIDVRPFNRPKASHL